MLGETSPEAQPIQGPRTERLDSTLKFIQRSRARINKIQADLSREQSLLQQVLESLERLRDEGATSVPEPTHRPQEQMDAADSTLREVRSACFFAGVSADTVSERQEWAKHRIRALQSFSEGCAGVRPPSLNLRPRCQLQRKISKPHTEGQKLVVLQQSWT